MNYQLNNKTGASSKKERLLPMIKRFFPLLKNEHWAITGAFVAIIVNSGLNLWAPIIIGRTIDTYIVSGDFSGVLQNAVFLFAIYIMALVAGYTQTRVMGGVAQRVLFKLRNTVFNKIQELPLAFFQANKVGDLISRINNDTDKLSQFFSQALMQFLGNAFVIIGAGIFVIVIHPSLGVASLLPAFVLIILTQALSPWIKKRNATGLTTTGSFSASIQESLQNFKVIIAFNRRDYFNTRLKESNEENYKASVRAGIANTIFTPVYGLASGIAQLIVVGYGIFLITQGNLTLGLLISFLTYVTRFYDPLRQMASVWSSFQLALASWERVSQILSLKSTLHTIPEEKTNTSDSLLEFKNVRFGYPEGKEVLHGVNFLFEPGKTYALVGPTGGGKTTTASLMARLYDPTEGQVLFQGKDLRSLSATERTKKIGFILQEPYLFTGTLRENILYGNEEIHNLTDNELVQHLKNAGLQHLLQNFQEGLQTLISSGGDTTSLGQRQLIAFIRAILRQPDLLILDEATANIDTVTESLLQEIIANLPQKTTLVVIAHRLNTIQNADQIFFVNAGQVIQAGSFNEALEMLMHDNRTS